VRVPTPAQADEIPEKYRDTVSKGLEYLGKNQHKDGHWEGDDGKHPVAMTGLAGLALLMERTNRRGGFESTTRRGEGKYSIQIRKAADWLMDKSQAKRAGLIFSEHASETARYMQGHGLATLFLAGVCKDEPDDASRKKLTEVLTRAVKYIVKAQSTQGGWYDTSNVEGHDFATISATVIQIQALQAAENTGIPVPDGAIKDAKEYLKNAVRKYEDMEVKADQKGGRVTDTAAALACRFSPPMTFHNGEKDELCEKWFKYCRAEIPVGDNIKFGRDELTHYYYAQAIFRIGGANWSGYRSATFDHLKKSQIKDGSWPGGDGISVGPVYSTAVWCIVLQLDKSAHPLMLPADVTITQQDREIGPLPNLMFATKSVGEPPA
jgi:hypothetical protein